MFIRNDACLQCGESREDIEWENLYCVTLAGYETVEIDVEWDNHRYSDWTDEDLVELGIHPDLWDENRRTEYMTLTNTVYGEGMCIYRGRHVLNGIDKVCVCCGSLLDDLEAIEADVQPWR